MQNDLNNQLMEAISNINVSEVEKLLKNGADANYFLSSKQFFVKTETDNKELYNQPNSPLKLVLFRLSDAFLSEADLEKLEQITMLLIKHGATKEDAKKMAIVRYGVPAKEHKQTLTSFDRVLNVIYDVA